MCYRLKYTGKQVDDFLGLVESGNGQGVGPGYNYENLANLPQINGVTLIKNQTASSLGLVSKDDLDSQNARIKTLEGNIENLDNAVTATEQKNTEQDTAIEGLTSRVTATEQKNTEQDTAIEGLTSRVTATEQKNTEQDTAIDNLQKAKANLDGGNVFTGVQDFRGTIMLGNADSKGGLFVDNGKGNPGQALFSQGGDEAPRWEDLSYSDLNAKPMINAWTLKAVPEGWTTLQELDVLQDTEAKAQNYYYSAAIKEAYLGVKPDTGILKAPVEVPIIFTATDNGTTENLGNINNNYSLNLIPKETYILSATINRPLSDPELKVYEGECSKDKLGRVEVQFGSLAAEAFVIADSAIRLDSAGGWEVIPIEKGSVFTAVGISPPASVIFESLKWKGATATNLLKQPLVPPKNAEYWMALGYELGLKNNQMYKITVKKGTESRDYLALAQVLDIGAGGAAIPTMICYAAPNPQQAETVAKKEGGMIVFYDGVNQYFGLEPNDVYMFTPIDGEEGDKVAEDYQIRAVEETTSVDSFALPLQFEFNSYNNITRNSSYDYYFGKILKTSSPLSTIAAGKVVSLTGTINTGSGAIAINGSATAKAREDGWEVVFPDAGLYVTNVMSESLASDEYVFIGVAFGTQGTGCTITNLTVAEGE